MTRQELERLEKLNISINEKLQELEDVRKPFVDNKTKCTPGYVTVRYPSDPTGKTGIKAAEKSIEIDKLIDEYYDLRCKACHSIRTLQDKTSAAILCQRYIHFKTWEEIQIRVKCRKADIFAKHKIALSKIK